MSRDGKVRLVERAELPAGWDPATDSRLTVWETTQHLIRALESSETDAAALLAEWGWVSASGLASWLTSVRHLRPEEVGGRGWCLQHAGDGVAGDQPTRCGGPAY